MRSLFTVCAILFTLRVCAQTDSLYWAKWDANYRQVNVPELLLREKQYADSIEKNQIMPSYYGRFDKYQFPAEYAGEIRVADSSVITSLKHLFKLFVGSQVQVDSLVYYEVLFKVDGENTWMPVQNNVLAMLKEELTKGEKVILYCAFFNEHTTQYKLTNSFLISEYKR